jgi:glycosyltransferase involved in cell wall biosynthesis
MKVYVNQTAPLTEYYKGQHLLIEALDEMKAQEQEIAALVVGKTIEADYLESLKTTVGNKGLNVTFLDFVDEPQRLMQICDCVLLSTYEETFGLVLAEAMRAGVAVVGSDRGGVPEIIEHEKSGLLFSSGDSHSLAQALLQLKQDAALRGQLATQGKEKADTVFNVEQHFHKLRQLLAS